MTTDDNAPEIVQPVDHSQQPPLFPPNIVAQHTSITGIPPALYEKLEGEQMDTFLSNMNASDERWAKTNRFNTAMGLLIALIVVGAPTLLLLVGRTETMPIIKELITHGFALGAGAIAGMGWQRKQNSN